MSTCLSCHENRKQSKYNFAGECFSRGCPVVDDSRWSFYVVSQSVKKKIGTFEIKCYGMGLRIPWKNKVNNADNTRDLNIGERWLLNRIMTRKFRYVVHVKRHSCLEKKKTVMEDWVPERRGEGRGTNAEVTQNNENTLKDGVCSMANQ